MPAPLYIFLRFLMIFVGLIAAALAAGTTLMFAETWGLAKPYDATEGEVRDALFANTLILSGYSLILGFLPAFVAGLAAEIFRLRSIVYFALAGAAIGVYLVFDPVPAWINIVHEGTPLIGNPSKAYPAAGIMAGVMYWLVTGCKAGMFRDTRPEAGASE